MTANLINKSNIIKLLRGDKNTTNNNHQSTEQIKESLEAYQKGGVKNSMIYAFLEDFTGDRVCSKLLYAEALDHPYNQPQSWETREICEIMNTGIASGTIKGWRAYKNPKRYAKYGSQKGWERFTEPVTSDDISTSVTDNSSIDNSMLQYGERGRARPVDKVITADDDLPFD